MIRLPYNYGIDKNGESYIVGQIKTRKDKKGNIVEFVSGNYYPTTIQRALKNILQEKQRELVAENDLTLQQAIIEFQKLQQQFKELLEKAIKEEI